MTQSHGVPPGDPLTLAVGARLGPYQIIAPIGAGGMGEVYRALDTRLGREVAIKIVSKRISADSRSLQRFEEEAKAIASLSHPNILAIHDFGTEGGIAYAVMELLDGESLADRLARERISWRKSLEIVSAVSAGLASAHARRIVHRDLKPANIFLTRDGQVKVLDFGLATRLEPAQATAGSETATQPDRVAGTIGYMSPEQITGAAADSRSDLFAVGCILYEMVSGRRAFDRPSAAETMAAILRDEPKDLAETPAAVPPALISVIRRCLEKNPGERFQSAADLGFALQGLSGSSASSPSPPATHGSRFAIVVAAVVALVAVAALWLALSHRFSFARSGIKTLAVLPMTNVSGDTSQEYLADGVTEQLISDLARISDLRVTSQTSSMSYKGTKKPLPQIAGELSVDAIVEGSVVRSGDRVRITAELIDAGSDKHLWSETYERDVNDMLSLQREIAVAVTRHLGPALAQAGSRVADARSIDPRSFDAYLRGRYSFNKGGRDDLFRAADQFQQALDADPTNAQAYVGLAETYALIGYWNYLSPGDSFPKARAAATRALEIDPNSAAAQAALGYIDMYYGWDFKAADSEFRKAIAENPNLASAHRYYAIYLASMLRPVESQREASVARTLDPLSVPVVTDSGFVMYYDRDYDKAIKTLRDAIALNPKAPGPHFWLGRVYQAQTRYDDAAAQYKLATPGISKLPALLAGLGHMYAITGRRSEALQVLQQIETMSKNSYVSPYAPALVYLGLGEKEKTLALLDRCLGERTNWMVWLLKDPRWDPMRSDPRFLEIVRKVGFPEEAQARAPKTS